MAITRFTQNTPVEHTGTFFQLPYEQLAAPILKMDKEYKEREAATDAIFAEYASKQYMPGDQEIATDRLNKLYEEEAKLRRGVDGNLLDPSYTDNVRSLFRKEANNIFYKRSAWNLAVQQQHAKNLQDHTLKMGKAPEPYLDPTGTAISNYTNALESGALKLQNIEPEVPFEPLAVELLKPMIYDYHNNPDGDIEVVTVQTEHGPRTMIKNTKTNALGANAIKDIIRGSSLIGGVSYNQLQRRFAYSEELQGMYGTFDKYFDSIVNQVATTMAGEYEQKSLATVLTPPREATGNQKKAQELWDVKFHAPVSAGPVPMATEPIGYVDEQMANEAYSYHDKMLNQLVNGGESVAWDAQGRKITRREPSLLERVYKIANLDPGEISIGEDGVTTTKEPPVSFNVRENVSSKGLSIEATFKNPETGKIESIDLINDPDAIHKSAALIPLIKKDYTQFLAELYNLNVKYTQHRQDKEFIEEFENNAVRYGFGHFDPDQMSAEEMILNYYKEKKGEDGFDKALYKSGTARALSALSSFSSDEIQKIQEEIDTHVPREIKRQILASGAHWKDLQELLGLDEEVFKVPGSSKHSLKAFVNNIEEGRVKFPSWIIDNAGQPEFSSRAMMKMALHELKKDGDPAALAYDEYFKKSYSAGMDAAGQDMLVSNKDYETISKSGMRIAPHTIYKLDFLNTSGSGGTEKWEENYTNLIKELQTMFTAESGFKDSRGAFPIYDTQTGEDVSSRMNGLKDNFSVVGMTIKDGFNIVIKDLRPNYFGKAYEIRNRDELVDILTVGMKTPKRFLNIMNNAMKSFYPEEGEPGQTNYAQDVMSLGQRRKTTTGKIGEGYFIQPIQRFPNDREDKDVGGVIPAGHIKYYQARTGKWVVHSDFMSLTEDYADDYQYMMTNSDLKFVNSDTFPDMKITGFDNFKENGTNRLSKTMISGIDALKDVPGIENADLHINSLYRPPQHVLSKDNPGSPHVLGDAVDFSIKERGLDGEMLEGTYNKKTIKFFNDARQALKSQGYGVYLEFPKFEGPIYQWALEEFPSDFLLENSGATGIHIHMQYKKPKTDE